MVTQDEIIEVVGMAYRMLVLVVVCASGWDFVAGIMDSQFLRFSGRGYGQPGH